MDGQKKIGGVDNDTKIVERAPFDYREFVNAAHKQRGEIGISEFIEKGNVVELPVGKFRAIAERSEFSRSLWFGDTKDKRITHAIWRSKSGYGDFYNAYYFQIAD